MELIKLESFKEPVIKAAAQDIIQAVLDGDSNPIHVLTQSKALIELAKAVADGVKDMAIDDAANYGKEDAVFNGAKFSLSQTGDTLDYEQDVEYAELNEKLKARKKLLKTAYDLFKKTGNTVIDDMGEITPVVGVKKESESIIKISFK